MAVTATDLRVKRLGKQTLAELTRKATRLGVTPERYVRDLVREDLALDRKARMTTLDKLWGPGRVVDEAELDELVEAARNRHHRQNGKRK